MIISIFNERHDHTEKRDTLKKKQNFDRVENLCENFCPPGQAMSGSVFLAFAVLLAAYQLMFHTIYL